MSDHLLKDELQKLQFEYRKILERTLDNLYQNDSSAVIDEIYVFWNRNKKLVECIMKYLYEPYKAYVFTGASILDIDDYEHYPFVSLGEYHFWDDPIYIYMNISGKFEKTFFGEKMHQQIISTIKDNIKILDEASEIIYILPLRLISSIDINLVHSAAQQAFLSLFEENLDFDTYKRNFKTIGDIKNGLSPNIENSIVFWEDDDISLDFETRFRNYKRSTFLPLSTKATDAEVFWACLYSYFAQAIDIILMCTEYKLIPYIRFEVAFKYILGLSSNFGDSKELKDMIFKCTIANILHHTFNKEDFQNMDFRKYYQEIQNYNFENRLFSDLQEENISISNPSLDKIVLIIKKNLEAAFAKPTEIND